MGSVPSSSGHALACQWHFPPKSANPVVLVLVLKSISEVLIRDVNNNSNDFDNISLNKMFSDVLTAVVAIVYIFQAIVLS